jgi:hypothetical protein
MLVVEFSPRVYEAWFLAVPILTLKMKTLGLQILTKRVSSSLPIQSWTVGIRFLLATSSHFVII